MLPDCTYFIHHLGYKILSTESKLLIFPPNGADESSPVENQRRASSHLVAIKGDISINSQKLVEDYGALCYSVSVSGWTLTRDVGSPLITIDGPGGTSLMQWDTAVFIQCPSLPGIHMEGGNVTVGDRLVIECGRLYYGRSDFWGEQVEESRRAHRDEEQISSTTCAEYYIDHLGYTIMCAEGNFIISLPTGADKTSLVENQRCASNHLVVTNGDISINGEKLVEDYGALCYFVRVSGWTLTRDVGSRSITIDGPGGRSPMQWNATFRMRYDGLPNVHMEGGNVKVGDRLVIKCGRLHDGESDLKQKQVEEGRRPSPNERVEGVGTPPTHEQIRDTRPSPPAYEQVQDTRRTNASHAPSDLGQYMFRVVRGSHTVDRYQNGFIYNNPRTNTKDSKRDLSASASDVNCLFRNGSVWLDNKQVIENGYQLPKGHPGRPQPQIDIFSDQ